MPANAHRDTAAYPSNRFDDSVPDVPDEAVDAEIARWQTGRPAKRYRWTVIFEASDELEADIQVTDAYGQFRSVEADHLETELTDKDTRV